MFVLLLLISLDNFCIGFWFKGISCRNIFSAVRYNP